MFGPPGPPPFLSMNSTRIAYNRAVAEFAYCPAASVSEERSAMRGFRERDQMSVEITHGIPAPCKEYRPERNTAQKISGSFTTRIFDCHVASFFRLRCSNLDLYIVTQRCQKAHQSFKRYLREFASQNLRELGLGSSESPGGGALCQTDSLDRLV